MNIQDLTNEQLFISLAEKQAKAKLEGVGAAAAAIGLGAGIHYGVGRLWDEDKDKNEDIKEPKGPKKPKKPKQPKEASLSLNELVMATPTSGNLAKYLGIKL